VLLMIPQELRQADDYQDDNVRKRARKELAATGQASRKRDKGDAAQGGIVPLEPKAPIRPLRSRNSRGNATCYGTAIANHGDPHQGPHARQGSRLACRRLLASGR